MQRAFGEMVQKGANPAAARHEINIDQDCAKAYLTWCDSKTSR
jgi:hypothetical protein